MEDHSNIRSTQYYLDIDPKSVKVFNAETNEFMGEFESHTQAANRCILTCRMGGIRRIKDKKNKNGSRKTTMSKQFGVLVYLTD